MLRKPSAEVSQCWPDVNGTVATDRMLSYNGCNISAEEVIDGSEMLFCSDAPLLVVFHVNVKRKIILVHCKYEVRIFPFRNLDLLVKAQ